MNDDRGDIETVLIDDDSTRVVSGLFCPICGGRFPGGVSNCTSDGTALLPVGTGDDLSGTVLRDKYVLVQRIGQGGFANVYRATHRMARAEVAVKVIRDELRENQKARRQFQKEARASMRMQSRYAVAVHDVDEDEAGRMYVVMELLRGQNLEDHMKLVAPETRRLKWDETARIVIEICDALEEAHDQGVIHRDLKPANVMMVEGRQGKLQAKVVDFGIAALVQAGDSDLTSMDNIPKVIGTPSFMSPEQARGLSVTHKSDLYSLGAMMYRMVCGCRPFDAKTDQGMLIAHVMEQPPSIRTKFPELDVPAAFDDLVMQLMQKKPEDRPADAADVADALRAMLPEVGAVPGPKATGGGRRSGRAMMPVAIVAAVLLVAAGAAAAWFFMGGGSGVTAVDVDASVAPQPMVGGQPVPEETQPSPVVPAAAPAVQPGGGQTSNAAQQAAVAAPTAPKASPAVANGNAVAGSQTAPAQAGRIAGNGGTDAPVPAVQSGSALTVQPSARKKVLPPSISSAAVGAGDVEILNSVAAPPRPAGSKPGTVTAADDDEPEVEKPTVKKAMDGAESAFDELNF